MLEGNRLPSERFLVEFPARPTWAEIDLTALVYNLGQARARCAAGQKILAVVKANAYGHGAVPVSRALAKAGVCHFAVATLEEALELRFAGLTGEILVLGGCYPGQEAQFFAHNLAVAVFSLADLERLDRVSAALNRALSVHLKFDTGMGRVGFFPSQTPEVITRLRQTRRLKFAGLMSPLACADDPDSPVTFQQHQSFRAIVSHFKAADLLPFALHLCNSAGLCDGPLPEASMVRPGIMLYGGYPAAPENSGLDLRPVMSLVSQIAVLRELPAASGISYGHSFHTPSARRIATLPIGYADGYNRLLSNCGEALVRGHKVPVVGRVCMDWIMLDVSQVENAQVGDRVVLLGTDGHQTITAESWAEKTAGLSYEVFCRISQRVPRHYLPVAVG